MEDDLATSLGLQAHPEAARRWRAATFLWRVPWLALRCRISLRAAGDVFHWWVSYGSKDWPPAVLRNPHA